MRHKLTKRAIRRITASDSEAPQHHQCSSYRREEVILGPTMDDSAILTSNNPAIDEICFICGKKVTSVRSINLDLLSGTIHDKGHLSPQLWNKSPVSNNPVIPFIIDDDTTLHPSLRECLQSLVPYNQGHPSGSQTSFSDSEIPLFSTYGMMPMTSPTFHDPNSGYVSPLPSQSTHVGVSSSTSGAYGPLSNGTSSNFPQHFPVYYYGAASITNGYGSASVTLSNMQPGLQRRDSGSPEGNIVHSTCEDFMNSLGMITYGTAYMTNGYGSASVPMLDMQRRPKSPGPPAVDLAWCWNIELNVDARHASHK
jgi:hypothetical protein